MRTCIVDVAVGANFPKGLAILKRTATARGYTGDFLLYENEYPPDSPSHSVVPYGFKTYALEEAQRRGYDLVLWCDSSMQFVQTPDIAFKVIERQGYYFTLAGFSVGEWCTDLVLPKLGVTREEAFKIPLLVGGFYGVNLRSEIGSQFMVWMGERARDGSLIGAWDNKKRQVSDDPAVLGHRHDQPCISVFVWKHGLQPDTHPGLFAYRVKGQKTKPQVIVVC